MTIASAFFLATLFTSSLAATVHAQDATGATGAAHRQVISASPLLWVFKWYNADFERSMTKATTWAVSGSFLSIGEEDYGRVSALFRYYPQGMALSGFSVGAQTGVFRRSTTDCTFNGTPSPPAAPASVAPPIVCTLVRRHEVRPGAGVDLGYGWLLGDKRQIAVSLGFGVSRVLGGSLSGSSSVIPNARLLNIGIAF